MKIWCNLIVFLCCSLSIQAQVRIVDTLTRQADNTWLLKVKVIPNKDVHVYDLNPAVSITAPAISFTDQPVTIKGSIISPLPVSFTDPVFERKDIKVYRKPFIITCILQFEESGDGRLPAVIRGKLSGFTGKESEFMPMDIPLMINVQGGVAAQITPLKLPSVDVANPVNSCGEEASAGRSAFSIFLLGFLGGLVALFTPCVFPMVPVSVSVFTVRAKCRQQGIRNGILYGLFIFLIYVFASLPFHLVSGLRPEFLNNIATSVPLNLVFFGVFLLFSLSFFGVINLQLPSFIANNTDSKGNLGSLFGIFCMSLTLVIVSFSCTGPILGSLLAGTVTGGAWKLTAGLCGFGLALGIPFGLFAVFPQLLKSLPRSGGWLSHFKKVLAFVELALAFKFLSNADLVMHWGLLKREIFIAAWIIIFVALGVYIVSLKRTQVTLAFSAVVFCWCVYLVPGLTNTSYANLSAISGIAPPISYSVYKESAGHVKPDVINDYQKALQLAKEQHKKILIDFTGWACVNCRRMEEKVWSKPMVSQYIRDHFILVSLYVDDKAKLPAHERSDSLQTIGDKWARFQSENFKTASQPLYVALDENEKLLTAPVGYTPAEEDFLKWLNCSAIEP